MEIRAQPGAPLRTEFNVMKAIGKHPHLIEYIEYAQNVQRVRDTGIDGVSYLALELAINKTLLDYLMTKPGHMSEKWTRFWFRQILLGL
jgi:serine/threonine protein kinase